MISNNGFPGSGCQQRPSARRCGAAPPSRRAIRGLQDWIDEAQAAQRTWARNTLILVVAIATAFVLAMRFGLLIE